MTRDPNEPWDDSEKDPEWEPSLAGPIYALLARDREAEEEIDRVLAYLGLA
jgi:hypothetical protein